MKYTVTLLEREGREKLVVESRGDLPRHVALKLVAYMLWRGETNGLPLQIELRVGQRHKPDLVAVDPNTGAIALWVDCGQIETERLGRIAARNPGTRVIVLKGSEREAMNYASPARKDLPDPCRAKVEIWGLDETFTDTLAAQLRGANTFTIERSETVLQLQIAGGPLLQTALYSEALT